MPSVLQLRRGTTSQNNAFTGAAGELSYDTEVDTIRVHDGSTAGGFAMSTASATETLTNKTLTAPKIASGGFIADANGNELIIFTTTSSAVNEITFANAASSGTPTITTTGGDTNISLKISPKGSGEIDVDSSKIINVTDPTANQHAATKAYVDSQVSSLSSDKINEGNSKVEVTDSGTGNVVINVDGTDRITSLAATTTTATGHSFVMGAASTSAAGSIKFLEGTDNGTNGVTLQGPASTADVTVTLPSSAGTLALANADTTGTAAIATTVTVADESSDTSCFPLFATAASGDLGPKSGSNLTFNSSSGLLTATSFAGALTGDVTGTADVATAVTVADESSDTSCNVLFVTAATGDLPPKSGTNLTFDSANGNLTTTTFTGTATAAQYADLAEMYASNGYIEPGTVVCFIGDAKVGVCNIPACKTVAGIVSTDPAHLMNSTQEGVALAIAGRVPCKVIGPVDAGDMMISAGGGRAKAFDADVGQPAMGTVIGKAIESHVGDDDTTGVIEVLAMMM